MGSVIIGSGRALPARIVTNDELSEIVDTTDEWIVPRTGIHTRHVAIEETCTDLGAQAALRALGLEEGGWQREAGAIEAASLDMIICPTLTADTHFPSEAARIRERIGATNAVCYDMSCACSGCVYGLSTADLIMAGAAFARQEAARTRTPLRCNDVRRVLVVAAERLSKLVDWEERATCILFGDGAGAVVLEGQALPVTAAGQPLLIAGVDDPAAGEEIWRAQMEAASAGADGAAFSVLLSHRPERAEEYAGLGFDLVLAGHAHGGQWRIPGLINGLIAPNQGLFPKYAGGMYDLGGGTAMIVSRGLARESTRVPRLYNPPELVVVDVVPAP